MHAVANVLMNAYNYIPSGQLNVFIIHKSLGIYHIHIMTVKYNDHI